ncbi:CCR4-NOT transcription complex subunit 8 isoform X2 [Petaurus breviceps papuanus]|uniref:CCR4-NOT transcription complex subunit 8 isoform X2 n=2 Tax=Petaurus breviceps papuanus TaxID=3040969 RepID=UPI0036DE57DA
MEGRVQEGGGMRGESLGCRPLGKGGGEGEPQCLRPLPFPSISPPSFPPFLCGTPRLAKPGPCHGMPAALVENSQVICEVWASNLEEEMRKIREIVLSYSYIAMLGLTFTNEKGEYPSGINTWQFNFKFNLTEDMYSQDSIDLLANSGLQFQKHEEEGIDTLHFAELLMTSGVVLCDNVKWLSFHSGYDFGYMVKLLTDSRLPEEEHEFFHILNLFFPSIYDVKYLMKSCKNLKGGLQEVADQLDLQRIGRQHQAGSDSLLTGMAFFRMKELFFEDSIDDAKYCGRLYGLGTGVAQKQNEDVDSTQEKMSILALINNMQQ